MADGVSIDETSEKDERDEVVIENFGVEPEISWDESPGEEEWDEAKQSTARFVATATTYFDDIQGTVK